MRATVVAVNVFTLGVLVEAGCGRIGFGTATGSPDALPGPAPGYFVLAPTSTAALGGLAGANARCLSVLENLAWRGKAAALEHDQLTAGNVAAWLCDSSRCQDFRPSQTYVHASTLDPSRGGYSVITDGAGHYPSDGMRWDESFQLVDFAEFYTGRAGDESPLPETCDSFTSSSPALMMRVAVSDTADAAEKRSKYDRPCEQEELTFCMVHALD